MIMVCHVHTDWQGGGSTKRSQSTIFPVNHSVRNLKREMINHDKYWLPYVSQRWSILGVQTSRRPAFNSLNFKPKSSDFQNFKFISTSKKGNTFNVNKCKSKSVKTLKIAPLSSLLRVSYPFLTDNFWKSKSYKLWSFKMNFWTYQIGKMANKMRQRRY